MSGIEKILNKKIENHLFPFFWQHGEDHRILMDYIDKISECGIGGMCIEARPHPGFVGDKWWSDMDCIIEKAKEHQMKLWILDDSHFPTGFANGRIKSDYPNYLKKYLGFRRFDVQGPMTMARIDFSMIKGRPWDKKDIEKEVIGVYMAKRASQDLDDGDAVNPDTLTEISDKFDVETRLLSFDIPDGAYSIFLIYLTREEGEETTKDYLNPLVKEATQVLLDEVYEPHFEHYKEEFGKTIQGFFSDEPRFGNIKGTEGYIGRVDMALPWRDDLMELLDFESRYLPLLWVPGMDKESQVRLKYMDVITRLYHENFTQVIGDWCQEHGVIYVGHNIEDNGAHSRLGYGTGHYFRGQQGMDMAGIDVIGGQVVPGMNYHHDAFSTGGSNGEFFHYALAKLGTSLAHLDPKKKGRTMCEAFGAYGWNEGLKMMKWIADHLMARGVNYIVPHAFDPKSFPDFDCPPHFYAHGHNPQFRYMKVLNDYINRVTSLFKDGYQPVKIGVLYTAETEWMGDYMPIEKPARILTNHQISFDIVPTDFIRVEEISQGNYRINGIEFEVFVVPYGSHISEKLLEIIKVMLKENVKVFFIDGFPEYAVTITQGKEDENEEILLDISTKTRKISLIDLPSELKDYKDINLEKEDKDLVLGRYRLYDKEVYMFFNEHVGKTIEAEFAFKQIANVYRYDAFEDKLYMCNQVHQRLHLAPYESCIYILSDESIDQVELCDVKFDIEEHEGWEEFHIDKTWKVEYSDSLSYPAFKERLPMESPGFVHLLEGWESRSGTLRFSVEIMLDKCKDLMMDLGNAYEIAEVFINGKSIGTRICKPYIFDLSKGVIEGSNTIDIEITNTLGTQVRDVISHYLVIEPFGIEGPIKLYRR